MSSSSPALDLMTARHSLSHALAAAVKKVCPLARLGIGPAIAEGCYYDFLLPEGFSFTPDVLDQVTREMKGFFQAGHEFQRREESPTAAHELFRDEPFKRELIDELAAAGNYAVGLYRSGDFTDLCNGPHVANSRDLFSLAWKLDRVSGAYWRGSEKNPMMQRIYALAFSSPDELQEYLHRREEAAKRDHRKIGADLELFMTSDLVGRGLPLLLPKGATLRRTLERFVVDEELRRGYLHVVTPHLGRRKLYEISGHWEHYQDGMYPPLAVSEDEWVLRPMTCPHHFQIYAHQPRSYRDLPLRYAEIASQFRKEQSGELSGLVRVMMFHLADAHLLCTPAQLGEEFRGVIDLIGYFMKCLGIDSVLSYRASLRGEDNGKYVDNPAMWEHGQSVLLGILDQAGIKYTKAPGEAAFYGPKLDVQMRNVLGKEETVFTVQIDFCLPERFDLTYTDEKDRKVRPVAIHRSSIGCLERTMAFLIEYYAGAFPLWLAPTQARILTITDAHLPFAREVAAALRGQGIRVEEDFRNESLGKKIREGRLMKIPYLVVLGDKEVAERTVSARNRDTGEQRTLALDGFVRGARQEVEGFALKLGM